MRRFTKELYTLLKNTTEKEALFIHVDEVDDFVNDPILDILVTGGEICAHPLDMENITDRRDGTKLGNAYFAFICGNGFDFDWSDEEKDCTSTSLKNLFASLLIIDDIDPFLKISREYVNEVIIPSLVAAGNALHCDCTLWRKGIPRCGHEHNTSSKRLVINRGSNQIT